MELEHLENIALKPIFSICGNDYGVIKDISLNDKYKIQDIDTTTTKLNAINIAKIDKIVIASDKKIRINKYKPKPIFEIKENFTVEITSPKLPTKATINEDLLLNRTVYHNITDAHNNIIIKQNTLINNNILDIARKHGKLKELVRYSF